MNMRRRDFITLLGGAAAWPLAVRAQPGLPRRVGALMGYGKNDPEATIYIAAFMQRLAELGWIDGRNLRLDVRWTAATADRISMLAKEIVALQPEVILTSGTAVTSGLRRETQSIPIVFTVVGDPVGDGFIAGLRRPEGNITGFISQEASMGGKWLELLVEIVPDVKQVAILFNPDTAPDGGSYYWPSFAGAARSLKVEPISMPVGSDGEVETALSTLAREPNRGLVVMPENFTVVHRPAIVSAAARRKLPTIYAVSAFARDGGLLSYGPDYKDNFRRAAGYVDRILRGANPAELPVQVPVKFELVVNLKTAKALGLTMPPALIARADEVIE